MRAEGQNGPGQSVALGDRSDPRRGEILAIVREIGTELHLPLDRLAAISTDTSFERDLGLDSLTRVEIISRVERHFHVTMPERAFSELETIGDLLQAVAKAPLANVADTSRTFARVVKAEPTVSLPVAARTLAEVLDWHAERSAERTHLTLCEEGFRESPLTYGQLRNGALAVARGLKERGIGKGDAVAIMLPTSLEYFFSFLGVILLGAIPVPIYPPARPNQIEDHLRRHSLILDSCKAKALVTTTAARNVARLLKLRATSLKAGLSSSEVMQNVSPGTVDGKSLGLPPVHAEDVAFLQYTSGSTGNPKGVILSHANLLANIRAMGEAVQASPVDVFVSWLPLYHDMGLIGAWLGSLYYAMQFVVMSPFAFLGHPDRWLKALDRYRGTITSAPNFAYELCLKRIRDEDVVGVDLNSVRVMCNGAEAVGPETIRRFTERFSPLGLKASAIMPVYGLAEDAVGLAFPPLGRGPRVDIIDREVFSRERRAVPTKADAPHPVQFVGCGQPIRGHEIRIVDAANLELPERREGRLQFRGPSATSGYLANPEETKRLFHGTWLDSGDLAYLAEGDVFITGRIKDIVKHAGRSIYPDELESVVGELTGIRKGCVAVFGTAGTESGTERLVVLAETRETTHDRLEEIRKLVRIAVAEVIGAAPDDVLLAPPHTVLKTSSGKVRRSASRMLYESGRVGVPGEQSGRVPSIRWQIARFTLGAIPVQFRRFLDTGKDVAHSVWTWVFVALAVGLAWPAVVSWPSLEGRWRIVQSVARVVTWMSGIRISVSGRESVPPPPTPCIFVSNHASYIDVVALAVALPRVATFTAKAELGKSAWLRWTLRRLDADFVERFDTEKGVADARRIIAAGKGGKSLLYFPEGTFTRRPGLLPFHMGAFLAAVETGLPVVPIAIRGTRSILHGDSWVVRSGNVEVRFLPAVSTNVGPDASIWGKAVALRDAVRREILKFNGEADLGQERA